jgi:excisionase family DNA binding protein
MADGDKRRGISTIKAVRLADALDLRATAMTVDEVAKLMNVSSRHIYQLVKDGKIPHFHVGGAVRFDPDNVKKWLVAAETKSPFY